MTQQILDVNLEKNNGIKFHESSNVEIVRFELQNVYEGITKL